MENENNGEGTPEVNEQPKINNKKIKLIIYAVVAVAVCFGVWFLAKSDFVASLNNKGLPEELSDLDLPSPNKFENMSEDEKTEAKAEMTQTFSVRSVIINEKLIWENPELVVEGKFMSADSQYRGIGEAKIYKRGSNHLIRFEKFEVTPGPVLHVLLSPNENPTNENLGDYIDLGELKGTQGNQNYLIDNVDISKYKSVVIYSEPYNIVFSVANLN